MKKFVITVSLNKWMNQNKLQSIYLDADAHIFGSSQYIRISQREKTDLVQGIGTVGDQLSEEDFFVSVQRVDDQFHHTVNLKQTK